MSSVRSPINRKLINRRNSLRRREGAHLQLSFFISASPMKHFRGTLFFRFFHRRLQCTYWLCACRPRSSIRTMVARSKSTIALREGSSVAQRTNRRSTYSVQHRRRAHMRCHAHRPASRVPVAPLLRFPTTYRFRLRSVVPIVAIGPAGAKLFGRQQRGSLCF